MVQLEALTINANTQDWGPSSSANNSDKFSIPYARFGKGDRLGRVADFTASASYRARYGHSYRGGADHASGTNADFQYKHDMEESESFQLVDTAKSGGGGNQKNTRLRPWSSRMNMPSYRNQPSSKNANTVPVNKNAKGQQQLNKRWDKLNNARRQYNTRRREDRRTDRMASVIVKNDWSLVEQFDLSQLTKLQTHTPEVTDVKWCGKLATYDDSYDRISVRTQVPLKTSSSSELFSVTAQEDPVLDSIATSISNDDSGIKNVFGTDVIIGHLMTCPRSVYPWDITVTRVDNSLYFDASPSLDMLTVNETSYDTPPTDVEAENNINHPESLSAEATKINKCFSQQVLSDFDVQTLDHANPFGRDENVAYRYRKWDLGSEIALYARCEVNGIAKVRGEEGHVTAYAVNEWDSKIAKGIDWRMKIDAQRGAILATELKNNSCKFAKWTAQALLSGADQMKLGYVSRVSKTDSKSHVVLGTHSYKPKEFASQIALNVNNMWGIIKMLVELFMAQPEGKYMLMKDPNKPVVRVYALPEYDDMDDDDDLDQDEEDTYDD